MATDHRDHLTCSRCEADLGDPKDATVSATAESANAEFQHRFGRPREPMDQIVCSECYAEILGMFAEAGYFGFPSQGTVH